MANILVLGVGPLPFEPTQKLHAPGIRTWQIASALGKKRHFVTLCVIDFGDFKPDAKLAERHAAVRQDLGSNISLVRLRYAPEETVASIRTLHVATRFAAVVSSSDIMNAMAADLELDIPMWLDYNGDPFAEKQLQASLYKHDGSLYPQWELYLKGLLHGDRFSVCSDHQRHALIGQLAFAGRLTGANSGEELVRVIPNCSRVMTERTPVRSKPLKGSSIPATSFLVLWSGGYNTWCDPETLFQGLELAMKRDPLVHFATTGGALEGHDTKSFEIFRGLVEGSRYKDRYVFLGWLPTEEVGAYFEQADLAIFADRYSVEGELGTRTRIVDWVQYNLPIACTSLCELTDVMAANDLITTFEIGSPESLAKAILDVHRNPDAAKQRATRAKAWFNDTFDEDLAVKPLTDWIEDATFSRDRSPIARGESVTEHPWFSELSRIQYQAIVTVESGRAGTRAAARQSPEKPPADAVKKKKLFGLFGRKN